MRRAERWIGGLSAAGLAALLSACAGAPRDASLPIDDPNEQFNRGVLRANQVDARPSRHVVKAAPAPVTNRIRDLDDNLKEPRIFGNNILQGRFAAAGITLERFVFNSIFGLGGLFDVAWQGGLPRQTGDFGQTMFVWGVPAGPYVVRPYYGPSTVRDFIGGAVDTVGDPLGWVVGYWLDRLAVVGRLGWSIRRGSSRPMERGRERLDRFLQLPARQIFIRPAGRTCAKRLACRPVSNRRPRRARSLDRRPPYGRL